MASEKSSQPATVEAFDDRGLQAIQQNFEVLFRDITSGFGLTSDDVTGVLPATRGGTGLSSFTTGDLLYASSSTTIAALALGAAGKVIRSNGTLPVYSTFTIADTYASGTIVRASAANTLSASSFTIQATFGTGGMIYASGTNTLVQLDIGTSGKLLRSNGTIPAWSTFTSVDTYAQGSIPMASTANTLTALTVGASGTILVGGTTPSYSATPTITTSVTVPLVIGGTAVGSTLTLKSTSGVGTTDAIVFQVGNNGATEAARFLTSGLFGIGTATPKSKLHIEGASGWIIQDEQDTDPTSTELDADDSIAIYSKNDTLVFAYNNGGTITYIKLSLDGSDTTWTHDTSAP